MGRLISNIFQCFYRSDTDPGIGFLVVRKDPSRREDLYEQWNAYNYLSQNYNRQHFLLGPPFEQNISEAFAYKLNSLASRGNHKDGGDRYLSDHPVVVQRVKRAHNMIRCHPHQQHLGSQKNHTTNLRGNSSDGRLLFSVQQNEECDEVEQSSSIHNGALPAWLKRMIPSCAQDVFVTLHKVKPMERVKVVVV